MATNRSGHRPAGGLHYKNVVQKPVKTGAGAMAAHKGGVAQLGQHTGDHTTNRPGSSGYRGEPLFAGRGYNPTQYGHAIAAKTGCGPGGSREVQKTGSQGQHGAPDRGMPGLPSTRGQWPDKR